MKAQDFRNLSMKELTDRISEMEREYYSYREAVRSGREKNSAGLLDKRRDVARARSVLQEMRQAAAA